VSYKSQINKQLEEIMSRVLYACLMLVVCASLSFAEGQAKPPKTTFGKKITVKEVTSLKTIKADADKMVGKPVLVSGKVVNVCKGKGCWVEIMNPDSETIICKSLDESVTVPKDCEGRMIEVQGKVKLDKKASGKAEMKKEGEGEAHACPAPKMFVTMEGVKFLDAAPVAPAVAPAVAPTGAAPVVAPATDKKDAAPAAEVKTAPVPEKKDAPAPAKTDVKPAPEKTPDKPAAPEKKDAPAPTTPPTPKK
jgi:hypothetical protein